jgi:hypothetical protein
MDANGREGVADAKAALIRVHWCPFAVEIAVVRTAPCRFEITTNRFSLDPGLALLIQITTNGRECEADSKVALFASIRG